jgi:hypothetical protein
MADVTAYMGVDPALADIRREQAVGFGETKYEIAASSENTNRDILNTGHNTAVKVDEAADKIQQRATDFYLSAQARDFDNSRDLAALRAQMDLSSQKLSTEILLSTEKTAAATALATEKVASAVALGQANLAKDIAESKYVTARQISEDGEKTRALINDLKNSDLNRQLIERNSDVNYYRSEADRWEGCYGNGQFASIASQINALGSQLSETRQGLYNFGTMAGVGQSSTSNQVGG